MVNIETEVRKNKDVIGRLLKLKDGYVKIGWYKGEHESNGLLCSENAYMQEHGFNIKHKNGKTTHVPARPFLTITMNKNEGRWNKLWKDIVKQYIDGKKTLTDVLNRIGIIVQADIRKTLRSNVPPPNADSTRRRKIALGRKPTTLIDTGKMYDNISYDAFEGTEK